MLGPDGDLVSRRSHRLPLSPLLLVGNQSSLLEDVVEENVHDCVVSGVDLTAHLLAVADDLPGVEVIKETKNIELIKLKI